MLQVWSNFACTHSHENVSGFYRVSVFFFAKVLVDLIPMRIVPLCIYSVIAYFMVGKYDITYVLVREIIEHKACPYWNVINLSLPLLGVIHI